MCERERILMIADKQPPFLPLDVERSVELETIRKKKPQNRNVGNRPIVFKR